MFDTKSPMGFMRQGINRFSCSAFLNSSITSHLMKMLAPTLDFKIGHILNMPFEKGIANKTSFIAKDCISLSVADWNTYETSWDYKTNPLVQTSFPRSCVGMQADPDKSTVCIPTEDGGNESAVGWVSDGVTRHIEAENVGLRDKAEPNLRFIGYLRGMAKPQPCHHPRNARPRARKQPPIY